MDEKGAKWGGRIHYGRVLMQSGTAEEERDTRQGYSTHVGRSGGGVEESSTKKRAEKRENEGSSDGSLPPPKKNPARGSEGEAKKRGNRPTENRTGTELTWDRMSTSFPFPSSPHWLPSTTSMPYGRCRRVCRCPCFAFALFFAFFFSPATIARSMVSCNPSLPIMSVAPPSSAPWQCAASFLPYDVDVVGRWYHAGVIVIIMRGGGVVAVVVVFVASTTSTSASPRRWAAAAAAAVDATTTNAAAAARERGTDDDDGGCGASSEDDARRMAAAADDARKSIFIYNMWRGEREEENRSLVTSSLLST